MHGLVELVVENMEQIFLLVDNGRTLSGFHQHIKSLLIFGIAPNTGIDNQELTL
jgi:hypothetical protein